MASSQVQFASSSSPFGCVLRDHNRRDHRYSRETNVRAAHAAFEKNLKELVRDHLNTCISISSDDPGVGSNDDSRHIRSNLENCWPSGGGDGQRSSSNVRKNLRLSNHGREEAVEESPSESSSSSSALMSPKEARILDRWAAKQAREMITTIERRSHEAELLALSNSHTVSSMTSTLSMRESSPSQQSDNSSVEIPNLGASMLVQRWRDFEAETKLNHCNSFNSNSCVAAATVPSYMLEETEDDERDEEQGPRLLRRDDEQEHYAEEVSWESNAPAVPPPSYEGPSPPPPPPPQGGDSDSSESERIRVVDIIRRLTTTTTNMTPRSYPSPSSWSDENDHISMNDSIMSREQRLSSQILVNSPRILRGRQAFNDLLVQLDRDRRKELQGLAELRTVSRFPQKGRIQSLLRLRFLHRELAARQEHRSPLRSTASWNQLSQRSTITLLRERFSTGAVNGGVAMASGESNPESPPREALNIGLDSEDASTVDQLHEGACQLSVGASEQQNCSPIQHPGTHVPEEHHEDSSRPSSDVTQQHTSSSFSHAYTLESPGTPPYFDDWEENVISEDANSQQTMETTYDWFSEIARPQRDWEDRRQERYQEMLHRPDNNGDIKQLLERRRVSSFLSSDLRETMDQLMASFLERQTNPMGNQGGRAEVEELEQEEGERAQGEEGFAEAEQHIIEEEQQQEAEEEDEENFNGDEEDSPTGGHQYYGVNDYYDQTSSSIQVPLPSLWTPSYDHEGGGACSDQVFSTYLPPPCRFHSHDNQQYSSCKNHPSTEMKRIYDLERHIEQLHREMSGLQKSMKSCMEMQVQLQHSIKQKASSDELHSVGGEEKRSIYRAPRKGICCVCYEAKVDSLLYRCGHMCTCLKCAQELQWSSRKCPICRAPIVDVVRAYAES